ncbi:MAG: hypothetical protein RL071_2953, partial [Pseudomonadota bacterium]
MARRPSPLRALFAVALAAPGCGAADLSQT